MVEEQAAGAPGPYNAKKALYAAFPAIRAYSLEIDGEVERFADELTFREWQGADTSFARTRLLELRWRTNATSDVVAARRAMDQLRRAMAEPDPPDAGTQDAEGSFAPGTDVFFLQLDRSTDQLLAREWPWRRAPSFLEPIDDPIRTYTYLDDLAWCDVRRRGIDTRKELNLAVSVIARLVIRGGQGGYLASPGMVPTLESFARSWRHPSTGFYGIKYVVDGQGGQVMTKDLSLTFHMVRYLPTSLRTGRCSSRRCSPWPRPPIRRVGSTLAARCIPTTTTTTSRRSSAGPGDGWSPGSGCARRS